MTKSPSKKTITVVAIAIVLAALAALSPVLLNSRGHKQKEEGVATSTKKNTTDEQSDEAISGSEASSGEDPAAETKPDGSATNATGAAPTNSQNQSAPDNDIPADGTSSSTNSEDSSQTNSTGSTNSPTSAPDNDIKAE